MQLLRARLAHSDGRVYSQRPDVDVVRAVVTKDLPAHPAVVTAPEHGEHRIALVANLAHFVRHPVVLVVEGHRSGHIHRFAPASPHPAVGLGSRRNRFAAFLVIRTIPLELNHWPTSGVSRRGEGCEFCGIVLVAQVILHEEGPAGQR